MKNSDLAIGDIEQVLILKAFLSRYPVSIFHLFRYSSGIFFNISEAISTAIFVANK